VRRLKIK